MERLLLQRLNPRLTRRVRLAFRKLAQFSFRHTEFRGSTIETHDKLGKYPHDRFVNVFQSGKMDGYLRGELVLVD
jgi:hypothetical protein